MNASDPSLFQDAGHNTGNRRHIPSERKTLKQCALLFGDQPNGSSNLPTPIRQQQTVVGYWIEMCVGSNPGFLVATSSKMPSLKVAFACDASTGAGS